MFPNCPYLPQPREGLDWRSLNVYRTADRGEAFYHACLEYGHLLWLRGFAARGLLCLDRAFGADLSGREPVLQTWPMPYAATLWFLRHGSEESLVGNPRVHFQHYADRLGEPRREQRRWRAWACWALARTALPHLPGDPKHPVEEPALESIRAGLDHYGMSGESAVWLEALRGPVDP